MCFKCLTTLLANDTSIKLRKRTDRERHTGRQAPNDQAEGGCCEAEELSQGASSCPTVGDRVCSLSSSTRRVFHRNPGRVALGVETTAQSEGLHSDT